MRDIKPFVGCTAVYEDPNEGEKTAIVTRVHSDDCVNLAVFYDFRVDFKTSVVYGEGPEQFHYMRFVEAS